MCARAGQLRTAQCLEIIHCPVTAQKKISPQNACLSGECKHVACHHVPKNGSSSTNTPANVSLPWGKPRTDPRAEGSARHQEAAVPDEEVPSSPSECDVLETIETSDQQNSFISTQPREGLQRVPTRRLPTIINYTLSLEYSHGNFFQDSFSDSSPMRSV